MHVRPRDDGDRRRDEELTRERLGARERATRDEGNGRVQDDVAVDEYDHITSDGGCSRAETAERIRQAQKFMGEMTARGDAT